MLNDYQPNTLDFLPALQKAVTPGGKEIFLSDIGNYQLQLIPKVQVKWTVQDRAGNLKPSVYSIVGKPTPKLTNAFYSKTLGKAQVEFNVGSDTYRADLNAVNFDLANLETLPGVQVRTAQAQVTANKAVEVMELENADPLSKLFYSIFGVMPKKGVMIAAVGIGALLLLKSQLKNK